MQLTENTTFANRYHLVRLLGRGGFSEVWLAKDSLTDLEIALKVYAPGTGIDDDGLKTFSKELAAVYDLNHSNLLKPQHVDSWQGMPYLVMSYCSKGSLVKRIGKMSEDEIWKVLRDVASGLTYLHERDIVHQDIKPDNILVDNAGNYVITDFGISTRARNTLRKSVAAASASSAGTLAYMGPERFGKEPTPIKASDIWSLGAMLFELMTGDTPLGEHGGLIQKSGAEIPTIKGDYSDKLKQLVENMLSAEPWNRPTASQLVKGEYMTPIPSSSKNLSEKGRTVSEGRVKGNTPLNSKFLIWGVVLLVIFGIGGGLLLYNGSVRDKQEKVALEQQMAAEKAEGERLEAVAAQQQKENEKLAEDLKKANKKVETVSKQVQQTQSSPTSTSVKNSGEKLNFTVNGVSFTMIKVEGGTFTMGATSEQGSDAYDDEMPTHSVTLSTYYMGETEVTQALWQAVMGKSVKQIANEYGSTNGVGDNYPMRDISYDDCKTFISKLNSLLSSQLGSKRFALPTEAQWEYAARGGKKSQGYKYSGSNNLSAVAWYGAWYNDNSGSATYPVKMKQANELGLYDMSGNVSEWCQDWYGSYSSSSQTNPQGPASGSKRVYRGGDWCECSRCCRVSNRNYCTSSFRIPGLRLCLLP